MLRSEYALYLSDIGLDPGQLGVIRAALAANMREASDPFSIGYDDGLNLAFRCLSGSLTEATEFEDEHAYLPVHLRAPDSCGTAVYLQLPADWAWPADQAERLVNTVQSLARPSWHELARQATRAESEAERSFWAGRALALAAVASAFSNLPRP